MGALAAASLVLQSAWSALWPARCPLCNEILPGRLSDSFCSSCSSTFVKINRPFCVKCGKHLNPASHPDDKVCGWCIKEPYEFDLSRSFGNYEGALARAVIDFKFNGQRKIRPAFGRMISHAARTASKELPVDLIVPVPLHPSRIKERGFNQAADLAKAASREIGRPVSYGSLKRVRDTGQQTGMSYAQRKKNVRGAFKVGRPEKVKDKNVLLVDDVMTTGATLNECARALKKAGARKTAAVTVARTP